MKEFEIITQANKYNWIDCSSTNQENSEFFKYYETHRIENASL